MIPIKSKYLKNSTQYWFLLCVMLFSIFTFSGFNQKILDVYLEIDKTELVESRKSGSFFQLDEFSQNNSPTACLDFFFQTESYNSSWVLHNFNKVIDVRFGSINKNLLTYNYKTFILPIKSLPSPLDEENPSFL